MFDVDRWTPREAGRLLRLDEASRRLADSAEAHGAEVIDLGASREGRPIQMVRFGDGQHRSLWYGGPHANEPVGIATIVHLGERLATSPELIPDGHGFDLVLCVDPDGYVENEDWFGTRDVIDPDAYYEHLYRPPADGWPDWDLPVEWTAPAGVTHSRAPGLPETRALIAAAELSRPEVMVALHNGEVGKAYFHVVGSADDPLADRLSEIPGRHDIPLAVSPIDMPGLTPLAPGVFPLPDVAALYQPMLDPEAVDPLAVLPHGESAAAWSQRRFGTTTLVPETPYWTAEESTPDHGLSVGQLALETGQQIVAWTERLSASLARNERWLAGQSGRARAVADCPPMLSGLGSNLMAWGRTDAGAAPATAEDVNKYRVMLGLCLLQRYRGMFLGALVRAGAPQEVVLEAREDFAAGMEDLARIGFRSHPIASIIAVHVSAGLTAIESVARS